MPTLRAIVSVDPEQRVWCSEVGCGHTVHKAIHVVQDDSKVFLLGSTCFAKRYGSSKALGGPSYGGSGGRQLTDAERDLLANNTAALLAQFEAEKREELRQLSEAAAAIAQRYIPPPPPVHQRPSPVRQTVPGRHPAPNSFGSPWLWAERGRSMLYLRLNDGTSWVRVEHTDGYQRLVPFPQFEGWDETFPESVGLADQELGCLRVRDIGPALAYVRQFAQWERVVGSWRELAALTSKSGHR